jgi:hypothetical protein
MGGAVALFGGRRRVEELEVELARTQAALAEAGALDDWQRAQRRQASEQQLACVLHEEQAAQIRVGQVQQELAGLQSQVIETRAEAFGTLAGQAGTPWITPGRETLTFMILTLAGAPVAGSGCAAQNSCSSDTARTTPTSLSSSSRIVQHRVGSAHLNWLPQRVTL